MSGAVESAIRDRDADVNGLLTSMDDQLNQMEDTNLTRAWMMAKQRCPPHLVNDNHKLMFLRVEDFHVELASLRLLRYWSMRLDLFGEDKAFQRITLDIILKEDKVALEMGIMHLPGIYDCEGRGIYFDDSTKYPIASWTKNKYVLRRSMLRVHWYIMECALEDDLILQNGLVSLSDASQWSLRFIEKEHMRDVFNVMKCMPIRFEVFHICFSPWFARLLNKLFIRRKFLGVLVVTCVFYHFTRSPEKLSRRLEQRGIPRSSVPVELGGTANLNYEEWLHHRRELESDRCAKDGELVARHSGSAAAIHPEQRPRQ